MKALRVLITLGSTTALGVVTPVTATSQPTNTEAANSTARVSLSEIDLKLLSATAGGDKKIVRSLIKQGANINVRDKYGRTPLMIAIQNGTKSSIVKLLVKEGVDVTAADNNGDTGMHYAVRANSGTPPHRVVDGSAILKELIKAGAQLNAENHAKQRPRDYLLNANQFAGAFAAYTNPEKIRKSRLGLLEDHMIKKGLLTKRSYPSSKLSFGRILQAATAGTIGGGVNQTRSAASMRSAARSSNSKPIPKGPITCQPTIYENLTVGQGKAISFAIREDNRLKGRSLPTHCIQKIVANSKVPFRGNTLIKYRIYLMYPRGYRTGCLKPVPDQKRNYWEYFEHTNQCNQFQYSVGGKPIEVGGVRYEDGETTI